MLMDNLEEVSFDGKDIDEINSVFSGMESYGTGVWEEDGSSKERRDWSPCGTHSHPPSLFSQDMLPSVQDIQLLWKARTVSESW
jgi:hypothetical protein